MTQIKRKGEGFWTRVISHFARSEWVHDPSIVSGELIKRLDRCRGRATKVMGADVPIIIHVAAGEPGVHSENSYHYPEAGGGLVLAVDFHFVGPITPPVEFAILMEQGFTGLGFYPEWAPRPGWHADIRAADAPVYWWTSGAPGNQEYHYSLEGMMEVIYDP